MTSDRKKILILGGAGFIGKNLSSRLIQQGHDVSVLNRYKTNDALADILGATIFNIDLLDFDSVKGVLRDGAFDTVIHLISNLSPGSTFAEFLAESDLNIKITCRLLDEIYSCGVKNFIYFSSGGTVYGNNGMAVNSEHDAKNPISLYGWYKNAIEQYIQTYTYSYPINYAILRASNPYGPHQNIYGSQGFIAVAMGNILNKNPISIWGDGQVVRDYIYIDDLTEMVSQLLEKGVKNNVFNLGTGEGHSLNSIIEILRKVTSIDFTVNYQAGRNVDVRKNILDVSAIHRYLGHTVYNNTPIADGMSKMWHHLIDNPVNYLRP